jgi:glycosyltransferase involved in cell wall biosynthesis
MYNDQIKISIITITFNSEKTIKCTLDSIKKQAYKNLEYIIIDGGSKDSTLNILNEYKDLISIIISEPDNGISNAMNKGIKLATGRLIGIIHSDDLLADNALNFLKNSYEEGINVFYGDELVMDENNNPMHILKASDKLSDFKWGFCINQPASFVTKETYDVFGLYDENLKNCMDYDFFFRLYRAGCKFKHINEVLAYYRCGGTNQKYRRKTINEAYQIGVKYGVNKFMALFIKYKKIIIDYFRPIIRNSGIHNKRVKKIN